LRPGSMTSMPSQSSPSGRWTDDHLVAVGPTIT
jgi:hypothetical protein